jgi:GTP-binding protein EngB required for normal cell division
MAAHGLSENHERGLRASVQYASKLIRDCEEILAASDRPSPLNRYTGGLTPPQRKIVEDYLQRLHQQLLRFLDTAGISPAPARISAVHALHNAMMFVENALEEMRGQYVRGYGAVSPRLLNALVGAPVLPTGILPMTSVPTRLRRGSEAAVHVTYAHGRTVSYGLERLGEFVTEAHNPGNEKRVARVLVDYPSDLLPAGVAFVDTPGLGSVASRGALQTFAYLPRCDHAVFLFDATAPLAEEDLALLAFLHEAGITTSVLLSKADLLSGDDLQRVQTYVASELHDRLGVAVGVRPVSVLRSHADLLRAWIAEDVVPLGTEAVSRRHQALVRKVEVLRAQAAAMLEQRTALPGPRAPRASEAAAITSRLRDVSAALERSNRELLSLSERREAIVNAALASAGDKLADGFGRGDLSAESVEVELARPAHDEAKRVAHDLERLADDVRSALGAAASAVGMVGPQDALDAHREVPLITLPSFPPPGQPPAWTRLSASLVRKWTADRLQKQWAPAVDRAMAAYLDVLKRWAIDGLAQLREEFESGSRPLLAQLTPDVAPTSDSATTAPVESDLRWLRQAKHPNTTRDGVPSPSIQE